MINSDVIHTLFRLGLDDIRTNDRGRILLIGAQLHCQLYTLQISTHLAMSLGIGRQSKLVSVVKPEA